MFFSAANSGVANLVARGNGDTMMTITWSPPANRHGFISRYRVNVLNNVTAQRSLTMMETDTMSSFCEWTTEMDMYIIMLLYCKFFI